MSFPFHRSWIMFLLHLEQTSSRSRDDRDTFFVLLAPFRMIITKGIKTSIQPLSLTSTRSTILCYPILYPDNNDYWTYNLYSFVSFSLLTNLIREWRLCSIIKIYDPACFIFRLHVCFWSHGVFGLFLVSGFFGGGGVIDKRMEWRKVKWMSEFPVRNAPLLGRGSEFERVVLWRAL